MSNYENIVNLYNDIYKSIATIEPVFDYNGILENLILLCEVIENYHGDSENLWCIGEFNGFSLDALIIQSYWHLTEWHGGQDSLSYSAMCAIGGIFSPGMSDIDDEEDKSCYELLNELAENHYNH